MLKKLLLFFTLIFFYSTVNASNIESINAWWHWFDTNTWVWWILPSDNDDVIINWPIEWAIDIKFNSLNIKNWWSIDWYNYTSIENTFSWNINIESWWSFNYNWLFINWIIDNKWEVNWFITINWKLINNWIWNWIINSYENWTIELLWENYFNIDLEFYKDWNFKVNNSYIKNLKTYNQINLTFLWTNYLKIKEECHFQWINIINWENLTIELAWWYSYLNFIWIIKSLIFKNDINNDEITLYALNWKINNIDIYSKTVIQNWYTQDNLEWNIEIKSWGKLLANSNLYIKWNILNNWEIGWYYNVNWKLINNGIWTWNIYTILNWQLEMSWKNKYNSILEIISNSNFKWENISIDYLNLYQDVNLNISWESIINIENWLSLYWNIINWDNIKFNIISWNLFLNYNWEIWEIEINNTDNIPINFYDLNWKVNLLKIKSKLVSNWYSYNWNKIIWDITIYDWWELESYITTYVIWDIKNNWKLLWYIYLDWNLENNWEINYIWNYLSQLNIYDSYLIKAPWEEDIITNDPNYLFFPHTKSEEDQTITFVWNKSWYIETYWIYNSNYIFLKSNCINIQWCVDIKERDWNTNNSIYNIYNLNDSYSCNINDNTSKNVTSWPLVFDISNLKVKIDAAEKLAKPSEDTSLGDPVILNTWEFDYENTLMSYSWNNLHFEFKIKYKNQAYYNWPIWYNFDFNYNIYLTQDENWNINIHDGKLWVFKFEKSWSTFERNETIKANLELINNKYEISFDDKTKYVFWDNFKIEKIIDTYGNNLSFEYNSDSQLTKITDTLNREYTLSYYWHSRIYKIIDFAWNEVEFIYFGENETEGNQFDLKTIKMINWNSEKEISFTYTIWADFESLHNIVKLIDSANNTYVENTYDSFDRVASQTYGNGTIYYNYTTDTSNKITKNSVTDREWNVIDYFYDSFWNTIKKVIKKTSGDLEYTYTYDTKNNLIKETKPLWNWVLYNYDVNNNVIEKRLVENRSSTWSTNDIVLNYTYDLLTNKPTQIIEPNWLITNLVYDTNNNLVSKEVVWVKDYNWNDIVINESFTYNWSGQLVSQTNAWWLETSFEYNAWNLTKITKWTWSLAIENNFVYDTRWNMVKIIDWRSNEVNLSYNDFNLLISKTTSEWIVNEIVYNSLNKKTSEKIVLWTSEELDISYNYDILDNLTQTTSEVDSWVNLITNYIYDTNSRIIETSSWSGAVESIVYDENGLVLSKTISYGNNDVTTNYTYDLNERLVKQINPNTSEINFEYDLFDRIIKKIDINWSYTIYTYDKSNNITKQEIYDENDILLSKQEFVYDKQNRVIETKNHKLPNDIIITKTKYDSLWNIIKTIDAKGNETNYTYDIFF